MAEVLKAPQAQADLEAILAELEGKNSKVADEFAAGVDKKCAALERFPESGRTRAEILPELRSTLVGKYVLFYRVRGDVVEVLRILHGRRDLRRIMRGKR
jgi:toxin ParE1/3/4